MATKKTLPAKAAKKAVPAKPAASRSSSTTSRSGGVPPWAAKATKKPGTMQRTPKKSGSK